MTDYLARAMEQTAGRREEEQVPRLEGEALLRPLLVPPALKPRRETAARRLWDRLRRALGGQKRPPAAREEDPRAEAVPPAKETWAAPPARTALGETEGGGPARLSRTAGWLKIAGQRLGEVLGGGIGRARQAGPAENSPQRRTAGDGDAVSAVLAVRTAEEAVPAGGRAALETAEVLPRAKGPGVAGEELYRGLLAAEAAEERAMYRPGPAGERATLPGRDRWVGESLPLLRALRQSDAGAAFVRGQRRSISVTLPEERPARPAWTVEELDRAVERDARRYDGGFPLY